MAVLDVFGLQSVALEIGGEVCTYQESDESDCIHGLLTRERPAVCVQAGDDHSPFPDLAVPWFRNRSFHRLVDYQCVDYFCAEGLFMLGE